jgi:uncharacterized hydrophobic protein (TIGR00271 family)
MTTSTLTVQEPPRSAVRESIRQAGVLSRGYLLMNILAATIASYGLLANSPAVVIGAMIVAMLLGPITGVALALVESDRPLLGHCLLALLAGVLVVMATGFAIGTLHRDLPITDEIMARTAPNLMDLMVALAGGAAGVYAAVSPRLSVALVGVAVATALVPPLCAASILLARGAVDLALGALLLTFTNMVAIQFAASIVLWMTGFRRLSRMKGLTWLIFLRRNSLSLALLAVLAAVLSTSLQQLVAQELYESTTRFTLEREINASTAAYLAEVRYDASVAGKLIVRAVVRGPNPPQAEQVKAMEALLPLPPDRRRAVELRIRFIQTLIISRDGPLFQDVQFGTKRE